MAINIIIVGTILLIICSIFDIIKECNKIQKGGN